MIINHTPTTYFQAMSAENDFDVKFTNKAIRTGGTITDAQVGDCNMQVAEGGSVDTAFDVSVMSYLPYTVTSLTPDIITIAPDGIGTFVTSGEAAVEVTTRYGSRTYTQPVMSEPLYAYNKFMSFATNTVRKYIKDVVDQTISGKTPGSSTQAILLNSVYDINAVAGTSPTTMIRNPNIITAGVLDIAATTIVTTGRTSGYFPAHLISPRHVIQAKHVKNTGKLVFLDNSNIYRTANVLTTMDVPNCIDTVVSYIDTSITQISPYHFLPSDWISFLPETGHATVGEYWLPVFTKKPQPNGDYMRLTGVDIRHSIHHGLTLSSPYNTWRTDIIGGDSGSGLYIPIYENGSIKTVLLDSFYTAAGADNYADVLSNIVATMNATAQANGDTTHYAVNVVDLSGYASF